MSAKTRNARPVVAPLKRLLLVTSSNPRSPGLSAEDQPQPLAIARDYKALAAAAVDQPANLALLEQ